MRRFAIYNILDFVLYGVTMSRALGESEKKMVAARQQWRCSECHSLLPSAYQVDHTVPLCDGGPDTIENCTAMCANCHAQKTQREAAARRRTRQRTAEDVSDAYDNRNDVITGGIATCELCMQSRPVGEPHVRCLAIDLNAVNTLGALDRFAFQPRGVCTTNFIN